MVASAPEEMQINQSLITTSIPHISPEKSQIIILLYLTQSHPLVLLSFSFYIDIFIFCFLLCFVALHLKLYILLVTYTVSSHHMPIYLFAYSFLNFFPTSFAVAYLIKKTL